MDVSRETAAAVFGEALGGAERYAELLATEGVTRGLLGPREADRLWTRHLLNSAVVAQGCPTEGLVADIGWRAHPDYRGEQSLSIIAHAAFVGIDHPGRAYIALAIFFRHVGLLHDEELSPRIRELASTRTLDRARVLGAALRVAYMVSASQPGVLPRTPLKVERHRMVLRLEGDTAALAGDRVSSRLKQLARLVGREPVVMT